MLRFILWVIILYFLWRFLRALIPFLQRVLRRSDRTVEQGSPQAPPKAPIDFKDIKDADFEELPKEQSPKNDGKST